jgi:hypothetical protein
MYLEAYPITPWFEKSTNHIEPATYRSDPAVGKPHHSTVESYPLDTPTWSLAQLNAQCPLRLSAEKLFNTHKKTAEEILLRFFY